MEAKVEIRRFERRDETDAVGLLVGKLPPSEREGAFEKRRLRWRWQYYENPNNPDGRPLIWVAEMGKAVVGLVATVPVHLRTPKGLLDAVWGVDFVVDPRFRGMGIGKKLVNEWMRGAPVAFVRGWSAASYAVSVRVGFKTVWGFTTARLVVSRLRFSAVLLKTSQYRDLMTLARVSAGRIHGRQAGMPPSVSVGKEIPNGATRLWAEVSQAYAFAVDRDKEYLNWRFISHPTHQYYFIESRDSGDLSGFAVARLTDEHPPLGIVSDMIVPPQSKDVLLRLLDGAISFFRSRGAYAVLIDLPPTVAEVVLSKYKCSITEDLGMIIYTSDDDLQDSGILRADSWLLSRSDSDADY